MNKGIVKFLIGIGVIIIMFLVTSCHTHSPCDAYSNIQYLDNSKSDTVVYIIENEKRS